MKKWFLKCCKVPPAEIMQTAKDLSMPTVVAQILAVRGYKTKAEIEGFLNASLDELHSPLLMKDMALGCKILLEAIEAKKKIVVFGDYDADGITATAILTLALKRLGAVVDFYIPQRETEGYGLNNQAIVELAAKGMKVLLTCDNGISAPAQVSLAKSLGITVIITDHHEVPFVFDEAEGSLEQAKTSYIYPNADAIINPKQEACSYPNKALCAGSISYKIVQNLYALTNTPWEQDQLEYLSLATIATVCDIMELVAENRAMVKCGLELMGESPNVGLQALLKVTDLANKKLGTYHIGFVIGPCINACGRLELADKAVNLFLATDEAEALALATDLVELNNSRKDLSNQGVDEVKELILQDNLEKDKVIVVYAPNLNESIAGIVAGRIKEIFYRPTFVLAGNKDIAKGSGRSIEGYNMFNALIQCKDLLDVFGGHPMAAGLSVPKENLLKLRKALNENCTLKPEDMVPTTYIDLQMPIEKASMGLANYMQNLEPFGKGNSTPYFGAKDLAINRIQLLGNNQQIVKIFFNAKVGKGLVAAIVFRKKDELQEMIESAYGKEAWDNLLNAKPTNVCLDIIYTVEQNNYNNNSYLQLQIKDFRINKQ